MVDQSEDKPAKPLYWVGESRSDLKGFPDEVRRMMGFALWQAQCGEKHLDAKPLRGFGGAGVLEVVEEFDGSAFRAVYTVKFSGAVYVLHAFQKKSTKGIKTPAYVMGLVKQRLTAAKEHYEQRTKRQAGARKSHEGDDY